MNLAESQAPEWSSKYPRIPESQQKMGSQLFLGQEELDQCGTLTKEDEAGEKNPPSLLLGFSIRS